MRETAITRGLARSALDEIGCVQPGDRLIMAASNLLSGGAGVRPGEGVRTELHCDCTCAFAELRWPGNPSDNLRGLAIEGRMYAEFWALMEQNDRFVCPTIVLPALGAGRSYVDGGLVFDGVANATVFDHLMTIPVNIVSRCPVMSVPSGVSREGLPTGVPLDAIEMIGGAAVDKPVRPWPDPAERRPVR